MGKTLTNINPDDRSEGFDIKSAKVVTANTLETASRAYPFFARKMLKLLPNIKFGEFYLRLPDSQVLNFKSNNKGPVGKIYLREWRVMRRAALSGTIGIAEGYMNEEWDSPNLPETLEFFVENRSIYDSISNHNILINIVENIRHWFNRNTPTGAKRNIASHYDLGNDFYQLWLDPSMTYSSALYGEGANSLENAQQNKYRHLAEQMRITPDSHVLEIGCGWGGFAEYVAKNIGARITGLTISQEQLNFARERIQKEGLTDRVELKFQDYRDETGKYDSIASIEMFEAVGEKYWPQYFAKIRDCLEPGGIAGLQIITIDDASFETYRRRPDFIQRYIFPGGMLPSPSALDKITGACGLALNNQSIMAEDYAQTLQEWYLMFNDKWNEIRQLGFDYRFKRMWDFYLTYCEAGFKNGGIDVRQMFFKKS